MGINIIVEDVMLWASFAILAGCILLRSVFFVYALARATTGKSDKWRFMASMIGRAAVPVHSMFSTHPVYTFLRYVFHICLLVAPLGFAGHAMLLEESFLNFGFTTLSHTWVDYLIGLTLLFIMAFLCRRVFVSSHRRQTSFADIILLLIVLLPCMSGYMLTHGIFENLENQVWLLHVLSGEMMLITIGFLFVTTRINRGKCLACTACVDHCPTQTLTSMDDEGARHRELRYAQYQCICCGTCMRTCPEQAVSLRHELSFKNLYKGISEKLLHNDVLCTCSTCGERFVPNAQLKKIQEKVHDEYAMVCQSCRQRKIGSLLHGIRF